MPVASFLFAEVWGRVSSTSWTNDPAIGCVGGTTSVSVSVISVNVMFSSVVGFLREQVVIYIRI